MTPAGTPADSPAAALAAANRQDPCEMVHPLSAVGSQEEILARALEVWVIKARQSGWQVEIVEGRRDPAAGLSGHVDVEGIRYVIRCGPRRRGVLLDDSTGQPVPKPILRRTVWAEPIVEEHLLTG